MGYPPRIPTHPSRANQLSLVFGLWVVGPESWVVWDMPFFVSLRSIEPLGVSFFHLSYEDY